MARALRLRSDGRGRHYGATRGLVESALRVLYTGGWPARLWARFPGACDVVRVEHRLRVLPPGQRAIRIGFVSDLHVGPTTPAATLDAAFAILAAAALDVLLLGGDYVFLDADVRGAAALADRIRAVPAARKLAVLGNHDLWTRHAIVERALERAGVELLINRSTRALEICVAGLDDPWTGAPDAAAALADACDDDFAVILCHAPEGLPLIEAALRHRPRSPRLLYLCGHTHGGHVATPWGPLVVPGPVGKRYPAGLYETPAATLHVSRGVGGVEVPFRTFAPPEVCVFVLEPRGPDGG